jgi:hypothetical protein
MTRILNLKKVNLNSFKSKVFKYIKQYVLLLLKIKVRIYTGSVRDQGRVEIKDSQ